MSVPLRRSSRRIRANSESKSNDDTPADLKPKTRASLKQQNVSTPRKSRIPEDIERELEHVEEDVQKPSELFSDQDVAGEEIYKFQTPVKKDAMVQKAITYKTSTVETPTKKAILKIIIERAENVSNETPTKSKPKSQNIKAKEVFTASKQKLKKVSSGMTSSESESVSEDSEYVPSDDDSGTGEEDEVEDEEGDASESNDSDDERNKKMFSTPKKPPRFTTFTPVAKRGKNKSGIVYDDYHVKSDEYFEKQSEKVRTSNRTLGRLKNPRLSEEKLQELLNAQKHVSDVHKTAVCNLSGKYKSQFSMWYFILEEGFSVLLYGVGSKRTLINDFYMEVISEHPTLIVNGFFPSLTIKEILDGIIIELLELEAPANAADALELIESTLKESPNDRLYLLIHNIDGAMLRSSKSQETLSRLASIPNLHLLASVDHINAALIWDNVKRSRFNFYWWDATTLLPYEAETSYESSLLVQQSGALALSSLHNVFLSLTSNARSIYMLLVKHQLQNNLGSNYPGMPFKDLYRAAREGFLVSSDLALRTQLTEFIDHKLVRTKRNVDGVEYLIIPLDKSLLKQFIEEHES